MKRNYAVRIGVVALTLLLLHSTAIAQTKTKTPKKFSDKVFFGGSVGLLFGTVTRVDILPQVGMWVVPQWAIGVGGRYTFRKENYSIIGGVSRPYKAHIWGVSGFTQIMPFPDLDKTFKIGIHGGPIFQGEWEGLYMDKGLVNPSLSQNNSKEWVHLFLVGVGYHFPLGEKAGLNLLAMWNLTNSQYSPYSSNPMLRISISF